MTRYELRLKLASMRNKVGTRGWVVAAIISGTAVSSVKRLPHARKVINYLPRGWQRTLR